MKKEYVCVNNADLKKTVNKLKEMGYKYIVKATDKWLSGWGGADN